MRFLAFIAIAVLTGCGTKGPLTMPPKAQPATAPAMAQSDHSSKTAEAGQ